MPNAEPASVLDASALMALMHDEEGSSIVIDAIAAGTAISVANWAEVLTKAAADGEDPQAVAERVRDTEFADMSLRIEPITEADCVEIAKLRPLTVTQGLSLADRAWTQTDVGADIKLIR